MALNLLTFRVEADTTHYDKILDWASKHNKEIPADCTIETGKGPTRNGLL